MKEAIYYLRDPLNAPRITVCLMKDDEGTVCRGLALCSLDDNPSKKDIEKTYVLPRDYQNNYSMTITETSAGGRTIARQRAGIAFDFGCSTDPILREEAINVIKYVDDMQWLWKSEYDIKPKNKFEKRLISQMN